MASKHLWAEQEALQPTWHSSYQTQLILWFQHTSPDSSPAKEGLILPSPVLCLQHFSGGEGRELDFHLWLATCEESELDQVKRILHAPKMLSFQVTPSHARLRNDTLSDCVLHGGGRRWNLSAGPKRQIGIGCKVSIAMKWLPTPICPGGQYFISTTTALPNSRQHQWA